jgi:hypothetical protein
MGSLYPNPSERQLRQVRRRGASPPAFPVWPLARGTTRANVNDRNEGKDLAWAVTWATNCTLDRQFVVHVVGEDRCRHRIHPLIASR